MAEDGLWPALTWADKILAFTVAICAIALIAHERDSAAVGGVLVIEATGAEPATRMLAKHGLLRVMGLLGESQIEIGARGAHVITAPCTHKICMRRGWIRQRGDLAVCVPNGLVLRIAGTAAVDAVVR